MVLLHVILNDTCSFLWCNKLACLSLSEWSTKGAILEHVSGWNITDGSTEKVNNVMKFIFKLFIIFVCLLTVGLYANEPCSREY
jgi:hypothetical protein